MPPIPTFYCRCTSWLKTNEINCLKYLKFSQQPVKRLTMYVASYKMLISNSFTIIAIATVAMCIAMYVYSVYRYNFIQVQQAAAL